MKDKNGKRISNAPKKIPNFTPHAPKKLIDGYIFWKNFNEMPISTDYSVKFTMVSERLLTSNRMDGYWYDMKQNEGFDPYVMCSFLVYSLQELEKYKKKEELETVKLNATAKAVTNLKKEIGEYDCNVFQLFPDDFLADFIRTTINPELWEGLHSGIHDQGDYFRGFLYRFDYRDKRTAQQTAQQVISSVLARAFAGKNDAPSEPELEMILVPAGGNYLSEFMASISKSGPKMTSLLDSMTRNLDLRMMESQLVGRVIIKKSGCNDLTYFVRVFWGNYWKEQFSHIDGNKKSTLACVIGTALDDTSIDLATIQQILKDYAKVKKVTDYTPDYTELLHPSLRNYDANKPEGEK